MGSFAAQVKSQRLVKSAPDGKQKKRNFKKNYALIAQTYLLIAQIKSCMI